MFSAQFHDYGAYTEAIQRVDARFFLHNMEQRRWRISGTTLPRGVAVQQCWSGSGAIAQGTARRGGIELAIPAAGHYLANGEIVSTGGALRICRGEEFLVSIRGAHCWFNVFVPDALLEAAGLAGADRQQPGAHGAVLTSRWGDAEVAALLGDFFCNTLSAPEVARSDTALDRFERELLRALRAAYGTPVQSPGSRRGRPVVVDRASIQLAVDAIAGSTGPAMATAELATLAGVSERSLRAGFHKFLGLSPSQYMQLCTYNRAWRRLSLADPEQTSVSRVAADLGIWDLGRFASRYRKLFGELPSTTLQRG